MAVTKETVSLHNGVEMPALGFGCAFGNWTNALSGGTGFQGFTPEEAWAAVPAALRAGYRHFDTAYIYGTHRHLGTTLGLRFADGSLKRSDIFVTTKVFHPPAALGLNAIEKTMDMTNPDVDVTKRTRIDFERSLDELGLGYVDLLLMHWPGDYNTTDAVLNRRLRKECWTVFEDIYKSGKARAIGVSNFQKRHLETLIEDATVVPMVNQIEISPYMTQTEVQAYCREKKIVVEAWGPFGSGATGVLQDPLLAELAKKYKKGVGQVILRWIVQQGMVALPKSSSEARMRENLNIFDFELSAEDIASITALNKDLSSVTSADNIA